MPTLSNKPVAPIWVPIPTRHYEETLSAYVIKKVPTKMYLRRRFQNVTVSSDDYRVLCFKHDDSNASLSVDMDEGKFNCFVCATSDSPVRGHNIVHLEAQMAGCEDTQAVRSIFKDTIGAEVSNNHATELASLRRDPLLYRFIARRRLLSEDTIDTYELGRCPTDQVQISIPIKDPDGRTVDQKIWRPYEQVKSSKYIRSTGYPELLYPYSAFIKARKLGYVVLCEGEFDALLLNQCGIPAVTALAGAGSFSEDHAMWFKALRVFVMYDNDKAGRDAVENLVRPELVPYATHIATWYPPEGDITDHCLAKPSERVTEAYWSRMVGDAVWEEVTAPVIVPDEVEPTEPQEQESEVFNTTLSELACLNDARRVTFDAHFVSYTDAAPVRVPSSIQFGCSGLEECTYGRCPARAGTNPRTIEASQYSEFFTATWSVVKPGTHKQLAKKEVGMTGAPRACGAWCDVEVMSGDTMQRALIYEDNHMAEIMLPMTTTLQSSTKCRFTGKRVPAPDSMAVTFVADHVEPVSDDLDSYELPTSTAKLLAKKYDDVVDEDTALDKLWSLAHFWSRRSSVPRTEEISLLLDLWYHSSDHLPQFPDACGMLDIAIIGAARVGKSRLSTVMHEVYDQSRVVSCNNASFAGLHSGVSNNKGTTFAKMGVLAQAHRRAVIMDEVQSLHENVISSLRSFRSERIIEVSKIANYAQPARTRLAMLGNPRGSLSVGDFQNGMGMIQSVVPELPDIARFDMVLALGDNVGPKRKKFKSFTIQAQHLQQQLLWVWSRDPSDVRLSDDTLKLIKKRADQLHSEFWESQFPIVARNDMPLKLARMATAVAGRLFSTDETFQELRVEPYHVEAAYQLMGYFLSHDALGLRRQRDTIERKAAFDRDMASNFANVFADDMVVSHIVLSGTIPHTLAPRLTGRAMKELLQLGQLTKDGIKVNPYVVKYVRKCKEQQDPLV